MALMSWLAFGAVAGATVPPAPALESPPAAVDPPAEDPGEPVGEAVGEAEEATPEPEPVAPAPPEGDAGQQSAGPTMRATIAPPPQEPAPVDPTAPEGPSAPDAPVAPDAPPVVVVVPEPAAPPPPAASPQKDPPTQSAPSAGTGAGDIAPRALTAPLEAAPRPASAEPPAPSGEGRQPESGVQPSVPDITEASPQARRPQRARTDRLRLRLRGAPSPAVIARVLATRTSRASVIPATDDRAADTSASRRRAGDRSTPIVAEDDARADEERRPDLRRSQPYGIVGHPEAQPPSQPVIAGESPCVIPPSPGRTRAPELGVLRPPPGHDRMRSRPG